MTDAKFLEDMGFTKEWGVRRQTRTGPEDIWLEDKAGAHAVWMDEEEHGTTLITRYIMETLVFDGWNGWKWDHEVG